MLNNLICLTPTGIIIATTQLLSLLLRKLRQPRGEHPTFPALNETGLFFGLISSSCFLVIAEVICGSVQFDCFLETGSSSHARSSSIILGPTVMGRVPGFTDHIFPEESKSYLNLYASPLFCLIVIILNLGGQNGYHRTGSILVPGRTRDRCRCCSAQCSQLFHYLNRR